MFNFVPSLLYRNCISQVYGKDNHGEKKLYACGAFNLSHFEVLVFVA